MLPPQGKELFGFADPKRVWMVTFWARDRASRPGHDGRMNRLGE